MWQRAFVLEGLAEITAIDPGAEGYLNHYLFRGCTGQIGLLYRGLFRVGAATRTLHLGAAIFRAQQRMISLRRAFCTALAASWTETHLISR